MRQKSFEKEQVSSGLKLKKAATVVQVGISGISLLEKGAHRFD